MEKFSCAINIYNKCNVKGEYVWPICKPRNSYNHRHCR